MERLLMDDLVIWKNKKRRKPLIIHGARQVGKTWIMKEFGSRYFEQTIYISFDNNERMKNVFDMDYDIGRIISAIKIEAGETFTAKNTLLIFDEIQEVPRALTSLKYFYENAPEYCIIAAGSLLGMALHEGTSFPVGKVDFLNLHPMNFREFLMAGGENQLADLLVRQDYGLINSFSARFADLLRSVILKKMMFLQSVKYRKSCCGIMRMIFPNMRRKNRFPGSGWCGIRFLLSLRRKTGNSFMELSGKEHVRKILNWRYNG